ncbi:MAG: hypothetical protein IJ757_07465 [Clostridiales bacterium]|nr:hypothetical protein [Clostridiales bacterium]
MNIGSDMLIPNIIFLSIWALTGIGMAIFIIYKIINKYNNFGDSTCTIDEYSKYGINYTSVEDAMPFVERSYFFSRYGENPYEGVTRSIPEPLTKRKENDAL